MQYQVITLKETIFIESYYVHQGLILSTQCTAKIQNEMFHIIYN